jgi:hypothetical protein
LKDPRLLSDEDADALVANVFDERPPGGFASGVARLYYANPTNSSVEITNRFFNAGGLSFFPIAPVSITAEEMLFNREGQLFFFDVQVRADQVGSEYNIEPNTLTGVEGIFGVLKVSNPRTFIDGSSSVDTASFVGQASQALSERSLVTRRGATARINKDFAGQVRAVQVIGANDAEMQRDLLAATSPGHAWLTGSVNFYKNVAYVRCRTVEGDPTADVVNVGDTLYVYLNQTAFPGLADTVRFVRLTVTKVMAGPMNDVAPFKVAYFVQWSGTIPVTVSGAISLEGGFAKKGTVQVSSLPSVGAVSLTPNNGEVHVLGHADIYVRPVLQPVSKTIVNGVFDYKSLLEGENLTTNGGAGSDKNRINAGVAIDFAAMGVQPGDLVVIEDGLDAGTYVVGSVATTFIYLTVNLTQTYTGLRRYRVLKRVRIDPFDARIPRFPFGNKLANDLATTIGSKLAVLQFTNSVTYGASVGDILRIKAGLDAGDYTITAFDSVLGGRGLILDRALASTNASLSYEIFTPLDSLSRPLVRVKNIELLDSSKQSTGITIPPAEPIGVVPVGSFTTARVRGKSLQKSGYVLPDLGPLYTTGLIPAVNVAATSGDRRYSLAIDVAQGNYRSMLSADGYKAELDFRTDSKGACSYFLAVAESTTDAVNLPPLDPRPGECLFIRSGPNAGSYLIKAAYKFKFHNAAGQEVQCYFLQIHGTFPVDVFGQLITFLQAAGGAAVPTALSGSGDIAFPTFFQNFRDSLGTNLNAAFAAFGASSPGAVTLQSMILDQVQVDYEWGDPARGTLRTYFQEPTLFEQWTGTHAPVTTYAFKSATGELVKFRPDPNSYLKQQLVPARLSTDTDPTNYPRDLDGSVGGVATFTDLTKPTPFVVGVVPGDVLSVHTEIFFNSGTKNTPIAVRTIAGSAVLTAPTASGTPFTPSMVGNLISIEEGTDKGLYRIVSFIDSSNVQVDRPMTVSTLPSLDSNTAQGSAATWQLTGGNDVITAGAPITADKIGKYISIWGIDPAYDGTFTITAVNVGANPNAISINRGTAGHFPTSLGTGLRWSIHDAPSTTPTVTGTGTEVVGVKVMRMYTGQPYDFTISAYTNNNPTAYTLNYNTTPVVVDGTGQPYRIYRSNIRRITPTEMAGNTDGPYCYFDTIVRSTSPHDGANLSEDSYLTLDAGTYVSSGYRHIVDDSNLTYSMEEDGWIDLPARLLPVGSSDRSDNYLTIVGSPVLIQYEKTDVVKDLQDFVDSPLDRVIAANLLVRHFLPQYVSYDATYFGGTSASSIAKKIIERINSLTVETPLDVSEDLQKIITNGGGNPETPTRAMVVTHDWDRNRWLEISDNKVGGSITKVPYNGTPRVAFFVPGPDVSGQETLPVGERINLTQG